MINFFRKIRKKLADDNKPLKYLRYGIGEIVLVVIGILIALQINNWNEQKKQSQKEHKILREIKENVETNVLIFQQAIKQQEAIIQDLDLFVDMVRSQSFNNDSINILFLLVPESVSLASTGFESLKTIGFDLISSDALRTEIIQLFNVEYPQLQAVVNNVWPGHNAGIIIPMIKKHFEVLSGSYAKITDPELLKNDPEVLNALALRRVWKKVYISYLEAERLKSNDLMVKINTIIGEM